MIAINQSTGLQWKSMLDWLIFAHFRENCPTGVIPEWMQKVTRHNGIKQYSLRPLSFHGDMSAFYAGMSRVLSVLLEKMCVLTMADPVACVAVRGAASSHYSSSPSWPCYWSRSSRDDCPPWRANCSTAAERTSAACGCCSRCLEQQRSSRRPARRTRKNGPPPRQRSAWPRGRRCPTPLIGPPCRCARTRTSWQPPGSRTT